MQRLTKRFIAKNIDSLNLSNTIIYERFYLPNQTVIQRKQDTYTKGTLANDGIINQTLISRTEFEKLKQSANNSIIRKSYLYLDDNRVSIKEYQGNLEGFIRAEVEFKNKREMEDYRKESWMKQDITATPLAFDSLLSMLSKDELSKIFKEYGIITDKN